MKERYAIPVFSIMTLEYILMALSILASLLAAYYAKEALKVSKGHQYPETPVDIDFLIPPKDKYELDWIGQKKNESKHLAQVKLPSDKSLHTLIICVNVEREDVRVNLGSIRLGFIGVGPEENPSIRSVYQRLYHKKEKRESKTVARPNWHGNISVPGYILQGGTQLVGIEILSPKQPGDYEFHVGVPCAEAKESKIEKLLVEFGTQSP